MGTPVPDDKPLNLPEVIPGGEVEPAVLDGELVDEPPPARLIPAPVRAAATSRRARLLARHLRYVAAGAAVAAVRWHLKRTSHERMMRAAEARGDHETVLRLREQREAERKGRADRRRAWAQVIRELLKMSPWIAGWALASPGILGIALAFDRHDPLWVVTPYLWAFHAIGLAVSILSVAWTVACFAVPAGVLWRLHHLGRTAGGTPGWTIAAKAGQEDRGLVVTADAIVLALKHLPVAPLKQAFKDGWQPAFHTTPIRDGEGYFAVFSVPMGVTPAMIADQNEIFARNLHRAKNEVWPTDAERDKIAPAGYVALWVANPGVLDRPAPEWPLLHEGTADVFKGVPVGVSPRGDAIRMPVIANNFAIGGMMGQGKSNACRVVMLGAALDPLPELRVHVFAYNGDFDAFEPRLAVYRKGAEEEDVLAALGELQELYEEVGRREKRISELGAKKVTRQIAEQHPDMRPIMTLFSECHELFGHKQYGEEATDLAVATIRKARKCAMWMGFDTQDSRKDAIPPKLVNLVSVNGCFYVKGWQANDGFLGAGSFRAGIRATELRPTRDIGRSLVTGMSDAQFEILKWHYIFSDDDTGEDDATAVIARAMANLAPGTPVGAQVVRPAIEARDLLADLAEVMKADAEPVRLSVLAVRLKDLAKAWGPYKQLNGKALREQLTELDVRTTNTDNVPRLDPSDLRAELARREMN